MKLIAKTLYGLEGVLSDELTVLGAKNVQAVNRAVLF
jgi:23S rRNA G2445 N2-methylase RlmL